MPTLAADGFRCHAVDLLGHGESDKPEDPEYYDYRQIYTSLETWLQNLKDPPPYILVGHSLGGHLSLQYTLRNPTNVRSMVLIDPFYSAAQLSPWLRIFSRRPSLGARALQVVPLEVIDTLLGWDPINTKAFSPQTRFQIAVDYKRASPNILNITSTIPDLQPELENISIPSLVIWGEKDLTLDPRSFTTLVSTIQSAKGHAICECGHQPHIGEPEQVNQIILDFISQFN